MNGMTDEVQEKSATLWEKTIVRAVRDLQWHYNGTKYFGPEFSIEFDGNIERALGDGVVSANDRLYLLELKGDAKRKHTEWSEDPGKLPFEALRRSLLNTAEATKGEMDPMHVLSMRGHLFAYWEALDAYNRSAYRPGAVVASSYLLDIAEKSPVAIEAKAKDLAANFSLGIQKDLSNKEVFVQVHQILASRLFTGTSALLQLTGEGEIAAPLGLNTTEMHTYVSWLIGLQKERDLRINALLMSRSGAVCQHVTNVDELMDLIERLKNDRGVSASVDLAPIETQRLDTTEITVAGRAGARGRKTTFKR